MIQCCSKTLRHRRFGLDGSVGYPSYSGQMPSATHMQRALTAEHISPSAVARIDKAEDIAPPRPRQITHHVL